MNLDEIIKKRASVRKYTNEVIPNEDIEKIIDAARLAPSAKNLQNWNYIAIKNSNIKDDIINIVREKNESIASKMDDQVKADTFRKFAKHFSFFSKDAPVLFVVYASLYLPSGYNELVMIGEEKFAKEDLIELRNPGLQSIGASVQNLYLKAIDLGYAGCWLTSLNYAAKEIEEYLKNKGIFDDKNFDIACLFALGKQDGESKSPPKKSLDEILKIVE